jgi:LPS export ABC transporter protein LptC
MEKYRKILTLLKEFFVRRKLAICILICLAAAVFTSCGDDKKIKPRLPVGQNIEDIPSFVVEGFEYTSTHGGVTDWRIDGKGAQVFEMKKKIYVQNFTMTTFEKNGAKSVLTGKRAIVNSDTNFMEVDEDVKFRASNGMILKTQKLFWDDKLKKMYTEAEVIIIRNGTVLKGVGLESDAEMKNMVIKKKVRLTAKDLQEANGE